MTVDVRTLFTSETATRLLSYGIELAAALGLNTTSWVVDSPERVLFKFLANALATRDSVAAELAKAAFLRTATGAWKTLVAQDVYGVTREAATYATPTVTLANGGGAVYAKAAGEVIVKSSATGVTFRSTEALSLASGPGTSATIELVADEAGSAGSVSTDDIDTLVSTMLGVTITSSTAAFGVDEQSDASLESECLNSLGSVSVNGPPDAYNAVCLDSALTGTTAITRAVTSEDDDEGEVTVWIAGATGAVSGSVVTLAQDAIEIWATPSGFTPTVVSATAVPQTIAFDVSGDDIPASAEADIGALVAAYLADVAIGGYLASSAYVALAQTYLVDAGATSVSVSVTASPTVGALAAGTVATLASCTVTEV